MNWDSFFWGALATMVVIETINLILNLKRKREK